MALSSTQLLCFRGLLFLMLLLVMHLATTQDAYPVISDVNDKSKHMLTFVSLAFLLDFSWPKNKLSVIKIALLMSYGLLIEVVQLGLPYREFSLLDLLADSVGIFLYWCVVPLLRYVPLLRLRWQ